MRPQPKPLAIFLQTETTVLSIMMYNNNYEGKGIKNVITAMKRTETKTSTTHDFFVSARLAQLVRSPTTNQKVPVSQGFRPPVISPPLGQILRDLAFPARPPLGISPPPPPPRPNDTFQRIFLYLDLATKKASEIWFGNLFDNESDSEPMLSDIFKS